MPDFRERVHRGETFVIAGDRFAIGSSREMSPAGLKGVAEEAGPRDGDRLRQQHGRHLPPQRAQPRAARGAESRRRWPTRETATSSSSIPRRVALTNVTQGKTYDPVPLTPKEDEIRRSGGIFAVGRREFRASVERQPVDRVSRRRARAPDDDDRADRLGASRRQGAAASCSPATRCACYADLLPASDGTAPFAIHTFNQITGGNTIYPRQAAIANDHFVFTGREDDERQTSIGRAFAQEQRLERPYYATPGDGIFHFYFPEQGLVVPGQFIPGADSHSRAYGAYGAVGIGVGSTTLGFGWATGYVYFTLAKARRVDVRADSLQPWVSGKDIVLELLRRWGAQQSQGMSVEFVDANQQLPIAYRNTIANMMAEARGAERHLRGRRHHVRVVRKQGDHATLPYPRIAPGADARFEIDEDAVARRRRSR